MTSTAKVQEVKSQSTNQEGNTMKETTALQHIDIFNLRFVIEEKQLVIAIKGSDKAVTIGWKSFKKNINEVFAYCKSMILAGWNTAKELGQDAWDKLMACLSTIKSMFVAAKEEA